MYEDSPGFESEERKMIRGVIEFKDLIVREVMIPRTDMVCIESGTTVRDAIEIAMREGFSRFPVYEDNVDNIKGILYVKDMIRIVDKPELMEHNIEEFVREPYFVPETKRVKELFDEFREKKLHVAIVVDEFGGTSGIITMEDILEEIVGEIEDEFDRQLRQVRAVGKGVYMIDARLHVDDLRDIIHIELPKGEDFDTVGGFLLERFGRIPNIGDKLVYGNVEFEVVDSISIPEVGLGVVGINTVAISSSLPATFTAHSLVTKPIVYIPLRGYCQNSEEESNLLNAFLHFIPRTPISSVIATRPFLSL